MIRIRKILIPLAALFICLVFSSCGGDKGLKFSRYDNDYHPETDYNPTSWKESSYSSFYTQTGENIYFIAGNYLYYLSTKDMKAYPVCFKATCLHNEEPDDIKRPQCDAFIGTSIIRFLQSYDDHLYLICVDKSDGTNALIRMRSDGTERETLLKDLDSKSHIERESLLKRNLRHFEKFYQKSSAKNPHTKHSNYKMVRKRGLLPNHF